MSDEYTTSRPRCQSWVICRCSARYFEPRTCRSAEESVARTHPARDSRSGRSAQNFRTEDARASGVLDRYMVFSGTDWSPPHDCRVPVAWSKTCARHSSRSRSRACGAGEQAARDTAARAERSDRAAGRRARGGRRGCDGAGQRGRHSPCSCSRRRGSQPCRAVRAWASGPRARAARTRTGAARTRTGAARTGTDAGAARARAPRASPRPAPSPAPQGQNEPAFRINPIARSVNVDRVE